MNYPLLEKELRKLSPEEWMVFHSVDGEMGGLYLWPKEKKVLRRQTGMQDGRLKNCRLLFEYHVTKQDDSRILARGWYCGNEEEWKKWMHWASESKAEKVIDKGEKNSKSSGKWPVANITFNTEPEEAAKKLRNFLEHPPQPLKDFIERLP